MAAAAVARIAGVSQDAMVRAVEAFTGLEHALEPVAVVNGVRFVNDSKATNIESAKQAIEAFDSGLVASGETLQERRFHLLREPLRARAATVWRSRVDQLISRRARGVVPVHAADTLSSAVPSFETAPKDGTVLLAPHAQASTFPRLGNVGRCSNGK